MSVVNHILSEGQIALVKKVLTSRAEKGKPGDYEIRLDKMSVVQRTNDVERFNSYKEFFSKETREISILIYEGHSRNNTHHLFIKQEVQKEEDWNPYSKMSPEDIINERVSHEKRVWENQKLQEENNDLKKKIEKSDDEKSLLTDKIGELEGRLRNGEKNWGHILSYGVEGALRRSLPLLAKVPGGEMVAEFIKIEQEEKRNSKTEDVVQSVMQSKSESLYITSILDNEFDKDQRKTISEILLLLAKKPESIEKIKAFLLLATDKKQLRFYSKQIQIGLKQIEDCINEGYNSVSWWIKQKKKWITLYVYLFIRKLRKNIKAFIKPE